MNQAIPMTKGPAFDPLIDPAEETHLEAEAERVFSPLEGQLPEDMMEILRNVFVIVAATHPNAVRARKRAKEGGPVLQSGVEAKETSVSVDLQAKGKAR